MKSYLMITGATGGLGTAFVLEAAQRGYNLFLTDRSTEGGSIVELLVKRFGIDAVYHPCDLADDQARERFLSDLIAKDYQFWGLINVAGLDNEGGFLERNRAQILNILQINILGTLDMIHSILPLHDPDQPFRLINVCSMAGFYPMPFKATYAASKSFLLNFSRALREEIKPYGTVTALCPSGMPTTIENMRSMFAQGFWGLATSMRTEDVARITMNAALKGRFVVIPGWINQFIHVISKFVPQSIATKYVAKRWKTARSSLANSSLL